MKKFNFTIRQLNTGFMVGVTATYTVDLPDKASSSLQAPPPQAPPPPTASYYPASDHGFSSIDDVMIFIGNMIKESQ